MACCEEAVTVPLPIARVIVSVAGVLLPFVKKILYVCTFPINVFFSKLDTVTTTYIDTFLLYFRLHVSTAFYSHHQAFYIQNVKGKIISN
jgi:hypothetical protein